MPKFSPEEPRPETRWQSPWQELVTAPAKFTVEEKNWIRRNLETFRPQTVSKAKAESEEFFKIIMAFPNPKPRHIEKYIKVFPWKNLAQALKKIISKYMSHVNKTAVCTLLFANSYEVGIAVIVTAASAWFCSPCHCQQHQP
ncbi:hypothetical protein PG985_004842 [Apiospora marii]|uniref:uncharacterized protein n=1 Tax=Apiospora marii TaxID=335849 RepID=UPI00312FD51E